MRILSSLLVVILVNASTILFLYIVIRGRNEDGRPPIDSRINSDIDSIGVFSEKFLQEVDACYCKNYREEYHELFGEVIVVDDIVLPLNVNSSKFHLDVCGDELKKVHLTLLKTLSIFHQFAEEKGLLYSLYAGNLISYLRDDGILLPHDDDLDLIIRDSDFDHLEVFWSEGIFIGEEPDIDDRRLVHRLNFFKETPILMTRLLHGSGRLQHLMHKWMVVSSDNVFSTYIGSIDLFKCSYYSGNELCRFQPHTRGVHSEDDVTLEKRCGVEFKVFKEEEARKVIERRYGNIVFDLKFHPRFQKIILGKNASKYWLPWD